MLRTPTAYHDLPLRAAAYTSRTPGSDEVEDRRALRGASIRATPIAAASVGLFDEKNTLKKQWTAQPADLAKRPVDGGARGAAGHLSRARRRRRRDRPRRHDRLRAEGGSAARRSAQAERAGARHAAAGRRLRAAAGVRAPSRWRSGCSRSTACRRAAPSRSTSTWRRRPKARRSRRRKRRSSPGSAEDMRVAFGGFSIAQPGAGRLPDARGGQPRRKTGRQSRADAAEIERK